MKSSIRERREASFKPPLLTASNRPATVLGQRLCGCFLHPLAVLVVCAIVFGGCGGAADHGSVGTATPLAVSTATAPAIVPSATATAVSTATVSLVRSPTPFPTSTSRVEATATPAADSTATPTPLACDATSPCFGGRFCELPSGVCGTALEHGNCVEIAAICPDGYAPVCGCDGFTYGNDCLRRGARVQASHDGACDTVECQDDCDCYASRSFALPCPLDCASCDNFWTCDEGRCFEHCGFVPPDLCPSRCSSNEDCTPETSCQKAAARCDGPGACRRRPNFCPIIEEPVCGCDGHSYNNDCTRERAGVSLVHAGACAHPSVGFVSVHVVDAAVGPVAGVDITIAGADLTAETNAEGIAAFEIPPGDYFVDAHVCCAGPGFIDYHEPITVELGQTLVVELRACLRCVCASPDTPIATPEGETPMYALAPRDLVYSIHAGQIVAVPVQATNRVAVHAHHVVRITLATGATLEISPGHPTADGRTVGDLHAGDRLGGVEILSAELVPYPYDHTYDILPASDSGVYFAAGLPLGSTLSPRTATGEQRTADQP